MMMKIINLYTKELVFVPNQGWATIKYSLFPDGTWKAEYLFEEPV